MAHKRKIFDDIKKQAYLAEIRKGCRRIQAAKNIGVDYTTVWYNTKQDAAFAQAISEAEVMACDPLEDVLYQKAMDGNITALLVWLYNRSSDRWQDKRQHNKVEINTGNWREEIDKVMRESTNPVHKEPQADKGSGE